MEHSWSNTEANSGNTARARIPQARLFKARSLHTLADTCVDKDHGKEGVDGSSPSEGLKNPLEMQGFLTLFVVGFGDTGSHRRRTYRFTRRI